MLGKNNFKERLRKMENQDKHDRFSIRKLTIGAASVLIGFAFMGFNAHSVQASEGNSTQSQTEEAATKGTDSESQGTDNSEQNKKSQADSQEQAETDKNDQTAKNDAKSAKQVQDNQLETKETKAKDNLNAQDSADKSNQKSGQDTTGSAKNNKDLTNGAKNEAKTSEEETGKTDSQTDDSGKTNDTGKTSGSEKAGSSDKSDAKAAKETGTVKDTNIINAANDLKNQMQEVMEMEASGKSKSGATLTNDQIAKIDSVLAKGQALLDKYNAAKTNGSRLTTSLFRSVGDTASDAGTGSDTETFNVGDFSDITGSLSGILTGLYRVVGNTATVSNENDLETALNDNSITTIQLDHNITVDKDITITNFDRNLTISGLNSSVSDGTTYNANNYGLIFSGKHRITLSIPQDSTISTSSASLSFKNIVLNVNGDVFKLVGYSDDSQYLTNQIGYGVNNLIKYDNVYVVKNSEDGYGDDLSSSDSGNIAYYELKSESTTFQIRTIHEPIFSEYSGNNYFAGPYSVKNESIRLDEGATVTGILREQDLSTLLEANNWDSSIGKNATLHLTSDRDHHYVWSDTQNTSSLSVGQGATVVLDGLVKLDNKITADSPKLFEAGNYTSNSINLVTGSNIKNTTGQSFGFAITTNDSSNRKLDQSWKFNGNFNITLANSGAWSGTVNVNPTELDGPETPGADIATKGYAQYTQKTNSPEEFQNLKTKTFWHLAFGTDVDNTLANSDAGRYNATGKIAKIHLDDSDHTQKISLNDSLKITDSENSGSTVDSSTIAPGTTSTKLIDSTKTTWIAGDVRDSTGNIVGTIDTSGNFTFASPKPTASFTGEQTSSITSKNDLNKFAQIKVTYADGTTDIVPVEIDGIGAQAKNSTASSPISVTDSSYVVPTTSTDTTTNQPTDAQAKNLIANTTDLSQFNPTYTFVDECNY